MKKNKIIGLLVAAGGAIASFSVASALYVKSANKIGFGIGVSYTAEDGAITYKIGGSTGAIETLADDTYIDSNHENGGDGYGGENLKYVEAHFSFPLSAQYSINEQPYVVGRFEIHLTNIAEQLQNHSSIWAEVKGWGETSGEFGADTWARSNENSSAFNYHDEVNANSSHYYDTRLTGATYDVVKDITVSTGGGQMVDIYVKLDSPVTESEILALADTKAFDLSVTWGGPTASYNYAYVVGSGNNWEVDDAYAMVPNLKSTSGFEWSFSGLSGFSKAKCIKHRIISDADQYYWSAGEDSVLDEAKTYVATWNDAVTDGEQPAEVGNNQAYFTEVQH